MPGVIETTIGLIASILQLAGYIRNLFPRICKMTSDSRVIKGCRQFVRYLKTVEEVVKHCIVPVCKETSVMRKNMEDLKLKLEMAKALVSDFLDENRVSRRVRKRSFLKDLEQSGAKIQHYINFILMLNREPHVLSDIAQDGHAHSGNEDSNYAISLPLSVEEQVMANRIGSSSEVYHNVVLARDLQQSLNRLHIGSPSRSNRLHIGSPSRSNRSHIGYPSRSNRLHIGSPSRSNRLHIGSPSRSNRLHIGSPSRSNRLHIGFPSCSNRLHIGFPSRSNRLHIGSPSRSNRLDIGFPSRSNQSPTDARDSSEMCDDEALQEGLDIGSPSWGRSQVDDDAEFVVLEDLN